MLYATTYYDNVKSRRGVRHQPTAGRGGGHPQAAASAWSAISVDGDSLLVGETRPRGPVGSICPDTENAPPCGRAERLRKVIAFRQNYLGQRIASYAHSVARRSFPLKRRQASQQALLQRAARPNFFPSRRNTLSQTLPAFGTRCQPRRCLRSSRWTSVVSSYRSNPTHRVSPSPVQPARCQPLRSRERFPI
jgi:hypothetical protein